MKVNRSGNVIGGGMVTEVAAGDDFPVPLIQVLGPGEEVPFQVTFSTDRPTTADYDQGTWNSTDWTRADIDFNVWMRAAVQEDDGSWKTLSTETPCVCDYPGSALIQGGDFGHFSIHIDTTEQTSDSGQFGSAAFGLSVSALAAAQQRLDGVYEFALNAGQFALSSDFRDKAMSQIQIQGRLKDTLDYLSEVAVWLPDADVDQLSQAVGTRLAQAYAGFTDTVTGVCRTPRTRVPRWR